MDKGNEGIDNNERELNIISNTRNIAVMSNTHSVMNILFAFGSKCYQYEIQSKSSFKHISTIEYTDDILAMYPLDDDHLVIAGKHNKTINLLSFNSEIRAAFAHNKKFSSFLLIAELEDKYLLYSDKFGEIHIKKITSDKEAFAQKGKILFGHCDPITFLQLSPQNKLLLSSDSFGKIKVYQFPNCFNMLTVMLYKNDEIKYVNFISEEAIIVLTNENEVHLWSTYDFTLNDRHKLAMKDDNSDAITSMGVLGINMFYIESKHKVCCFNIDAINRKVIPYIEYNKSTEADEVNATRVFMFNNEVFLAAFNSDYSLVHINSLPLTNSIGK